MSWLPVQRAAFFKLVDMAGQMMDNGASEEEVLKALKRRSKAFRMKFSKAKK